MAHTLAQLIQAGRRSAALSQQALADLAGLSLGAVRDLEQGRTRWPRKASLRRLAQVLSLTEPQLEVARGSNQRRPLGRSPESAGGLRLWVLGSLEIRRGHTLVSITSARQRAVLGLLALAANEMVPRSAIIDTLWPDRAPESAIHLVQTYIAGLRHALVRHAARIERRRVIISDRHCYSLLLDDRHLDLATFRRLVGRARVCARADDLAAAFEQYTAAVDLWRGPALADVDVLRGCPQLNQLAGERLDAILEYADLGLALGLYRAVLPQLAAACDRDPLNGALGARFMLALAGGGQQVTALRYFEQTRDRLNRDLGIDPDPELSDAFRRVLRQDLSVRRPDRTEAGAEALGIARGVRRGLRR